MSGEDLDIQMLARYLRRDARDLEKLASRGRLPARRIGNEWRFHRGEIHQWLDQQMSGLTEVELEGVEQGVRDSAVAPSEDGLLVANHLSVDVIEVPLEARTAPGVLQRLVEIANRGWQVYSPEIVLEALREREQLCSTALPGGVAIPHPRRPLPQALGHTVLAFGRSASGIPFGEPNGQLTDLFFLVLCLDEQTHLRTLARLSRIFQREHFLSELRACGDAASSLRVIRQFEEQVAG